MNYNVFFSPTGGTKKVIQYIGTKFMNTMDIDISLDIPNYNMKKDDFCIIGVPSFGGRVPEIAVKRLKQLRGNQTPSLIVATYGNRAYEDTLKELKDVMEAQGFICIGAAAIVTQHSIMPQYGTGRPNQEDLQVIDHFVLKIKERLLGKYESVTVPGNYPYKELHVIPMQPQATDICKKCGLCVKNCPVHAIPPENPQLTDNDKCISCMRCVSICPFQARKSDDKKIAETAQRLKDICSTYKADEFFLE